MLIRPKTISARDSSSRIIWPIFQMDPSAEFSGTTQPIFFLSFIFTIYCGVVRFVQILNANVSLHCRTTGTQNGYERDFIEHHFGRLSSFSENAHNSCTAWNILFKFCILMYFYIAKPLLCKTVMRLHQVSFSQSSSFCENAHTS